LHTNILEGNVRCRVEELKMSDGIAVEAEQEGFEQNWQVKFAKLNPAVRAFQTLTVRKW
jgi:hypothetical protein